MKNSTKAVLLSAFIFPGVGHVFLKRYLSAIALIVLSFAGLYYLTTKAVEKAVQIAGKIQSGDVPLDVAAITKLVSQQSMGADAQLLDIAAATLLTCWLVGIVDAYRVGCAHDKGD